jgi:hypothetical protein
MSTPPHYPLLILVHLFTLAISLVASQSLEPLEPPPNHHFLYVTFHQGTRTNFDAIALQNNWKVSHIRPASGYITTPQLARDAWHCCYAPLLERAAAAGIVKFTHVLASDTIVSAGYPFLLHASQLRAMNITLVLHVTNYFDYMNEQNSAVNADIARYVHEPNVRVIAADRFIELYLWAKFIRPPRSQYSYLPLTGRVVSGLRNPSIDIAICGTSMDFVEKPIYYPQKAPVPTPNRVVTSDRLVCPGGHHDEVFALNSSATSTMPALASACPEGAVDIIMHQGYGGPLALLGYDAVIYVPYHYSTISVQEFLALGLRVFVPSESMLTECAPFLTASLMDIYQGPLAGLVEKYEGMEELVQLVAGVYAKTREQRDVMRAVRREYMRLYDDAVMGHWAKLLA